MSNNRPIRGMNPLPGFNGLGTIDLNDYQSFENLPTQINGTFSHIGSIDLDEINEDDSGWLNDSIRNEGNTLERIEDFVNTFELKGFKTQYEPPIMGTDGKPRDGRGRVIAAKRRGEKYIPALFYSYDSDTERCRISNGVKENLRHDPAYKATREDITTAALHLISCGEIKCKEKDVDLWLSEIGIQNRFNSRNITIILKDILKRGEDGGQKTVRERTRSDWERWCLKNLNKKVNGQGDNKNNVWLTSVDNDTYPFRIYAQCILPFIKKQVKANENSIVKSPLKPAEIIVYTNKKTHKEAIKCVKEFKKELDKIIQESYDMVGLDYDLPFKPKTPKYIILGGIPQLIGKHDVDGCSLVPIDDY